MSYLVLARKWRPNTFDEVVGQEHITRTLKNAITQDRVAHALLFTGSRRIGKTSCARILSRALNCAQGPRVDPCGECPACLDIISGNSVDVFEIDGASNNSVEQIREIREAVKFLPTRGKRKSYIIDEVHMLTTSAFNALLKTLEEPPEHVLFIFATTEPHKIPETIHSRCQRFDFKRISEPKIIEALEKITRSEKIRVERAALGHIAREAKGGMRDSLSLLDQLIAFCGEEITEAQVREVLGIADRGVLHSLSRSLLKGDASGALEVLDSLFRFGLDLQKFAVVLVQHLRDLMVVKVSQHPERLVDLPRDELEAMALQIKEVPVAQLHRLFNATLAGAEEVARSSFPKLVLEMTLLRLCNQGPTQPLAEVLEGLMRLEARLEEGGSSSPNPEGPSRPFIPRATVGPTPQTAQQRPRELPQPAFKATSTPEPPKESGAAKDLEASLSKLERLILQIPNEFLSTRILHHARFLAWEEEQLLLTVRSSGEAELRPSLPSLESLMRADLARPNFKVELRVLPTGQQSPAGVSLFQWCQARDEAQRQQQEMAARNHPRVQAALRCFQGARIEAVIITALKKQNPKTE